ncbi:MAG: Spherulation-specific family 4 [Thermodesulfobacteria bacterium]|nr:Spherulation-specific family 4 [Thermodesulfobacteriota bacterium]
MNLMRYRGLLFIFLWLLSLTTSSFAANILYPLYSYPNWWNQDAYIWDDIAAAGSTCDITAIINPSNGPGGDDSPNEDYIQGLQDLANGNIKIIGYVPTGYGQRNIEDVEADISKYQRDFAGPGYTVSGIFLDEVSTSEDSTTLNYYENISNFIMDESANPNLDTVVMNHGTRAPAEYLSMADINVIFEGNLDDWNSVEGELGSYFPEKTAILVYGVDNVDDMEAIIDRAIQLNITDVFITDDAGSNPWDSLPSYWTQEVEYVASASPVPLPTSIQLLVVGLVLLMLNRVNVKRGFSVLS